MSEFRWDDEAEAWVDRDGKPAPWDQVCAPAAAQQPLPAAEPPSADMLELFEPRRPYETLQFRLRTGGMEDSF